MSAHPQEIAQKKIHTKADLNALGELPPEIWAQVFSLLSIPDLISAGHINKSFHLLVKDELRIPAIVNTYSCPS